MRSLIKRKKERAFMRRKGEISAFDKIPG